MECDNKMQGMLNEQLNAEMASAYLYLAMAIYFEENNLKGFAHWMNLQAKEEMDHAMRFLNYIQERRWQVKLSDIKVAEGSSWSSPKDVFEHTFAHEKKVTSSINNIMDLAVSTKDYATQSFLRWFIDEQVEEESSVDEILQRINLIGEDQSLLLMFDAELGKRVEAPVEKE